jgi:hypothetical protein
MFEESKRQKKLVNLCEKMFVYLQLISYVIDHSEQTLMTALKNPHNLSVEKNWTCYRDTTRWKEERMKLLVRRRRIINFAYQ